VLGTIKFDGFDGENGKSSRKTKARAKFAWSVVKYVKNSGLGFFLVNLETEAVSEADHFR
jgi:hypothetical protein